MITFLLAVTVTACACASR